VTPPLALDPAVPQRDALLAPVAVAEVIAERLVSDGAPITRCERVRATYRCGDGLRVLHRIEIGGETLHVAARTFPPERLERIESRLVTRAVPTDPLRPVVAVPELGALFWTFPNDRKLPALPALPRTVAGIVGRDGTSLRLVAYAPEKSAAVECLDAAGRPLAYAKIYADEAGANAARLHDRLANDLADAPGALRLPGMLGYSAPSRTLVLEPVAGAPVSDAPSFQAFGAALGTLHDLEAPPSLPQFRRLLPDRVDRAARIVGTVRPDVREAAEALGRKLVGAAEDQPQPLSVLHGDVHPKNALVHDGRIALIDLDQVVAGAPAAELGSALAGLEYRRVAIGDANGLEGALLEGYATVRHLPTPRALAWHTAAALLAERALRAVARIRPEGLAALDALIARADAILAERA
jgi:Phosphotransferase enzyme family